MPSVGSRHVKPASLAMRSPRPAAALLGKDHWVIFVSLLLWSIGSGLYSPIWAPHAMTLGATPRQVGLLYAILSAASAVGLAVGTATADRWERRSTIIWSWWLAVPGALTYALARTWKGFLPGVVLLGISMFSNPALTAYVGSLARPDAVSRTMSYVFASFSIGMAIGPAIGGALAEQFGIRLPYYLATGLFVASAVVIHFIRPQDPLRLGMPARVVVAGACDDVPPRRGRPRFDRVLVFSLWFAAISVFQGIPANFATPYLSRVGSYRPSWLGAAESALCLGATVFRLGFGALGDLAGNSAAVCAGLGVLGISNLLFISSLKLPLVLVACFGRGALDGVRGCMTAQVMRAGNSATAGADLGRFFILTSMAAAVAPYLGGALYSADPRLPFAVACASTLPLALGLTALDRRVRNAGQRRTGTPGG